MNIYNILDIDTININLDINNKEELVQTLIAQISKKGCLKEANEVTKEIYQREKILSTGIGKGIALPHTRSKYANKNCAALAILKNPIEYDALDGEKVRIVFMLIGLEDNVVEHLKYLSKISRLLNNLDFRKKLLACTEKSEIIELFQKIEEKY